MVGDGKFQQDVFVQRVLDEKCSSSVAAQTGQIKPIRPTGAGPGVDISLQCQLSNEKKHWLFVAAIGDEILQPPYKVYTKGSSKLCLIDDS